MAYLRLLWMYYDSEKPLKPDSKILAFQIGASIEDTELLLEAFFWLADNGWHHTRCDQEIAEYHALVDKKANAGRASAERRKNNSATPVEQVLNTCSTDVQLTSNQKPITNNQKPKKESQRGTRLPVDFVLPEEWIVFCNQERQDLNPHKVFAEFKDYWCALPAGKGTKTDWMMTWRNWVRRQQVAKKTESERTRDQMHQLTRGLATPKPQPFWAKTEPVEVIPNVEPKRLL